MSLQIVSGGRESCLRSITLVAWERSAVRYSTADPASRRNTRSHQQQRAAAGAPVDRRAHAGPDAFSVRCCHRSCRVCAGGQLVGPYDASVAEGMKRGDMEQSSRARSCTVGDLDELDISHRVTFTRPPNDPSSRPRVSGRLKRFRDVDYLIGNMRRPGIELVVAFPRQLGGETVDVFGPLPLTYLITVGLSMQAAKTKRV